jgi:hypothetical protein
MHECPADTFVPIYLVGFGVCFVFLYPVAYKFNKNKPEGESELGDWGLVLMAIILFQAAWLIAGEFTPNSYYL